MFNLDSIPAPLAHALARIADIENRMEELDPSTPGQPAQNGAFAAMMDPSSPPPPHTSAQVPAPLVQMIAEVARRFRLRPGLLSALVQTESGFNANAVSPKGAMGLTQLMPDTAKALGVGNPYDAQQNLEGGAQYLRQQLDRFGDDESLALAAYNAGPGAVLRYQGVPPYAETRAYVQRVLSLADQSEKGEE